MISGTYFKRHCRYRIGDYIDARKCQPFFIEDKSIDNNFIFVQTHLLNFFSQMLGENRGLFPNTYSLVLHNSDLNISKSIVRSIFNNFIDIENLYTQNLLCDFTRTYPIPIGFPNPKWSHGNITRIQKVISQDIKKNNLVYINFNISTNPKEREYCLEQIGSRIDTKYPNSAIIKDHDNFVNNTHEKYLQDIKASYFTVSPDGNGKDCHKTWESIFMRSIPIVTDSYFARTFRRYGLPILVINDWREYSDLKLSASLYYELWKDFDPSILNDIGFWFRHD